MGTFDNSGYWLWDLRTGKNVQNVEQDPVACGMRPRVSRETPPKTISAIYLAARLKGPAQTALGDLDVGQKRYLATLKDGLNSRFGSENQTEMHWARLRSRIRG